MPIIRANLEVIKEENVWEDIRFHPTEYLTFYSGTNELNVETARMYHITLMGSATIKFIGYKDTLPPNHVYKVFLILKQGKNGNKIPIFPSNIKFINGVTPYWSILENKKDVVMFTTMDNGTTWTGQLLAKGFR